MKKNKRRKYSSIILKFIKNNAWILIIFLILIFINYYIIFLLEKIQNPEKFQDSIKVDKTPKDTTELICPIEYGKPECINSSYFIVFYNPNNFDIHKIQIIAKKQDGTDIISVDSPLIKNKTELLVLPECYEINKVDIRWCCADICYNSSLSKYSRDLKLIK